MCMWLSISMFKLRSLMNIGDESGVGRKICSRARFLLMLWPSFFINASKKDNRPMPEKIRYFCIHPPKKKNGKFNF